MSTRQPSFVDHAPTIGPRPRALLMALLGLTALEACKRASPPATPAPRPPAPAVRGPEELTREAALQVFAQVYGELPGVSSAPRPLAPGGFRCGTEAARWVRMHWSSLSPAQQQAVRAALSSPPRTAAGAWSERFASGLAGQITAAQQASAQELIDGVVRDLSALLHHTLRLRVRVYTEGTHAGGADSFPMLRDNETLPLWLTGLSGSTPMSDATVCRVRLNAAWWADASPRAKRMVLGHEVFHCFQFDVFRGTREDMQESSDQRRPWLFEGGAAYVGERLSGGTQLDGYWLNGYFSATPASAGIDYALHQWNHPAGPGVFSLYRAGYDAIGFFSTITGMGVDPLRAGANGEAVLLNAVNEPTSDDALARVIDNFHVFTDVPSAATRLGWSPAWTIRSPLVQDDPGMRRVPGTAAPLVHGAPLHLALESGAMQVISVPFGRAPFVRVRGQGHGHLAFDRGHERTYYSDVSMLFCQTFPCVCPDGRTIPGDMMEIPAGASSLLVAHMAPPRTQADLTIDAPTTDDLCGPTPPGEVVPTPTGIDPCLTGAWTIDRSHELEVMRAEFPSQVRVQNIRGSLVLHFDGHGRGGARFNNYCVETESNAGGLAIAQKIIFTGGGDGDYTAAANRLNTSGFTPNVGVRAEVTIGGQTTSIPVPVNSQIATAAVPSAEAYQCSAHELVFRDARHTRYTR